MSMITPAAAPYYKFNSPTAQSLGPTDAFQVLTDRGCNLVTQPWVDNHWNLILWKLAGMTALDPESEGTPSTKRWSWEEVIRQLLYRCVCIHTVKFALAKTSCRAGMSAKSTVLVGLLFVGLSLEILKQEVPWFSACQVYCGHQAPLILHFLNLKSPMDGIHCERR